MSNRFILACAFALVVSLVFFAAMAMPVRAQTTDRALESSVSIALEPDLPSGQPVGTTVTWSVEVEGISDRDYRLSVGMVDEPVRVMYDYTPANAFHWTPIEEGTYTIQASVRNLDTGEVDTVEQVFEITSRVIGRPIVTPTDHPLVALYSAPPCRDGQRMRVIFKPVFGPALTATNFKPCRTGYSMNFYIAGMRAGATYAMVHEIRGEHDLPVSYGPVRLFHTGDVDIEFHDRTLRQPPNFYTSVIDRVTLTSPLIGTDDAPPFPYATDLAGEIIWYDDSLFQDESNLPVVYYRLVEGGTLLAESSRDGIRGQVLQEIDLAGNIVRQTNRKRVAEQLAELGFDDFFGSFHHEARRLPNGHTAVIGSVERIMEDVQGVDGEVNIYAEYVIVLDEDWQVDWVWNSFDHLDVDRAAILGDVCVSEGPGCPPLFLDEEANDWLHANAIAHSPTDGNLLLSMRHQDWVIKINYADGEGDGSVVWRLGQDGDFEIDSSDPYPWFSYQHDPNYVTENRIVIYDNGNVRCEESRALETCHSRGQVYELDEENMTASLVLNADLQNYAYALGSAQPLTNGNYHFNSGIQSADLAFFATADEILPDGSISYSLEIGSAMYRSHRLEDLYTPSGQTSFGDLTYLMHLFERVGSNFRSRYLPVVLR